MSDTNALGYTISVTPYGTSDGVTINETELRKIRINILDKDTGEAIEEVDVYTSAESVLFKDGRYLPEELIYITSYTNYVKTPSAIGGIAEGTSFTSVQFKDLITQLLYPYTPPVFTFSSTIGSRYYEMGIDISPITFMTNISKKSNDISSVELWRGMSKYGSFKNFPATGGTGSYNYTEKLDSSSSFQLKVNDGYGIYTSDPITVIFNTPIYYGSANNVDETILKLMNKYIEYDNINDIEFNGTVSPDEKCIVFAYKSYPGDGETIHVYDTNGMDITRSFESEKTQVLIGTSMVNYTCWKSNVTKQSDFKITIKIHKS